MKKLKKILIKSILTGVLASGCLLSVPVCGANQGSLGSVTEEAQILPLNDGSGKYMLKSTGFYCLNEDGTREQVQAIHYFDHFVIDGTEFNGYYYHDTNGKFQAASPHVVQLKQLALSGTAQGEEQEIVFDGYYMVNNLGKLSAAPQVRYMNNLTMNGVVFDGYYYFDERGKMMTDPGIHEIHMNSNGQSFDGSYYFGGINGVLVQESGTTPEGFGVDETGRVTDVENLGIATLQPQLKQMTSGYTGTWGVYVKNLDTDESMILNDQALYSASLIKVFVMARTYAKMDDVLEHEAAHMNAAVDNPAVQQKIDDLLWNMITVSDNESCNELVRLQGEKYDFSEGAKAMNEFLEQEGFAETTVQHTLHPSSSQQTGLGGRNTTSVKDCGILLEKIYNGELVSPDASAAMLELLKNQEVTWKIPMGVPDGIATANKTGETDTDQHDIAIIYGEKTTYILCVMSENSGDENAAVENIRDISRITYTYLNY